MFIRQYDQSYFDRNKIINFGQYQKHGPGELIFNNNPPIPQKKSEDEIKLSKENQNLADHLTKLTLKMFNIEANKKELSQDNGKIKTGLDYFI